MCQLDDNECVRILYYDSLIYLFVKSNFKVTNQTFGIGNGQADLAPGLKHHP